jgi:hypothetical protein
VGLEYLEGVGCFAVRASSGPDEPFYPTSSFNQEWKSKLDKNPILLCME